MYFFIKKLLSVVFIFAFCVSLNMSCTKYVVLKDGSNGKGLKKGHTKNTNNPHNPNTTNPVHTKNKGKKNSKSNLTVGLTW